MMNKIVLLCAVVALFFIVPVNAQECQTLRVAGAVGWLPVTYINKQTQEPEGIAYDFARFIGKRLKVPVDIQATLPWKRMLVYLEKGIIDMSAAMYKTKEREKLYQYTDPYFVNTAHIFVRKGKEFLFTRFEDLIGLTGGIPPGGSFGDKFDTFAKTHQLKFEGVDNKDQRYRKLLNNRIDYFIQDYLDGMMFLQRDGQHDKIVALPHPVSTTNVYFSLSRKSPCVQLIPKINEIIKQAKVNGELQAIIDKYVH